MSEAKRERTAMSAVAKQEVEFLRVFEEAGRPLYEYEILKCMREKSPRWRQHGFHIVHPKAFDELLSDSAEYELIRRDKNSRWEITAEGRREIRYLGQT